VQGRREWLLNGVQHGDGSASGRGSRQIRDGFWEARERGT
jgi:hypothetical protein